MPRLPDYTSLGNPGSLVSGRPMVSAGAVDGSAAAAGMKALGGALVGLSGTMKAKEEKDKQEQNALDLLRAEASHRRALNQADRELADDTDYETQTRRFGTIAGAATENASKLIRDPAMREKWSLRAGMENETALTRVDKQASKRIKESRRVQLEETLEEHRNVYSDPDSTPEQRKDALAAIETGLTLGERSGLLDPSQARTMRRRYRHGAELQDAQRRVIDDPEGLIRDFSIKPNAKTSDIAKAAISARLETGSSDPLEGVANISPDSAGSKSYGNFGLNTGGSLQEFVNDYGEALGLEGKPGSAEFDKSWKSLAAADPEFLHNSEMQWYAENITSKLTGRLTNAGVPDEIAGDPRVQAYFADRSIQQGEGSIDKMEKHSNRIKQALADADGDPEAFLKNMTELDREALYSDFPTAIRTGVYGERGHDTRLDGRLEGALSIGQRGGKYSSLSPLERAQLEKQARGSIKSSAESNRAQLKQMLADDLRSVRETGVGAEDFDLEAAKRVLDKSQISDWEVNRMEAAMEYRAMSDIHTLTEPEIQERISELTPKPGENGYAMKAKVLDKTEKQVRQLRTLREKDPAEAVNAFEGVDRAMSALRQSPGDPALTQDLIGARLDAQDKIGITPSQQSPITRAEAKAIMARTKGLSGRDLYASLAPLQDELEAVYGPYANAVSRAAIAYAVRDNEIAGEMQGMLDRAFKGLDPDASAVRRIEMLNEGRMASDAFGLSLGGDQPDIEPMDPGTYADPFRMYGQRTPPAVAVDYLKANPALAPYFDAKYGTGTSSLALNGAYDNSEMN